MYIAFASTKYDLFNTINHIYNIQISIQRSYLFNASFYIRVHFRSFRWTSLNINNSQSLIWNVIQCLYLVNIGIWYFKILCMSNLYSFQKKLVMCCWFLLIASYIFMGLVIECLYIFNFRIYNPTDISSFILQICLHRIFKFTHTVRHNYITWSSFFNRSSFWFLQSYIHNTVKKYSDPAFILSLHLKSMFTI